MRRSQNLELIQDAERNKFYTKLQLHDIVRDAFYVHVDTLTLDSSHTVTFTPRVSNYDL